MEKIIVELEAKTDKALKGIDNVAKSVEELGKEVSDSNKETTRSLKGVETASKGVAKGVQAVGTGLKAIGLGLIIGALGTLKELFEQNQKAVDFFSVAFETASVVVGQMVTAFTNVFESVSQSSKNFDALGKVLGGILTTVITPFKLGFFGIKLAVQSAQLAWEKSFFGGKDPETIKNLTLDILETKGAIKNLTLDILETKGAIIEVGDEAIEAGKDIVNNFGEAITETTNIAKNVVKEVGKISVSTALETAKANTELQKSAEIAGAMQGLLFEKFDRQAEKLRQIRDEERNTLAERKKANDELLIAVNNAEQAMLSQANQQLAIANANLKKDSENLEFKVAQIEALKELAGVEAQIEGLRSEQKANDLALDRESIELTNSKRDSELEIQNNKRTFDAEQIESELARLERQKLNNEIELTEEKARLESKRNLYKQGTIAFQDAQNELTAYQQANGQKQITIDKAIGKSKEKIAMDSLGAIAGVLGQNSKFGKALAITSAIRDTYTGANKAISQGGIYGAIAAAGVIVSGFANVKQIVGTKEPAQPSFATGGGSGGGGVSVSSAPSLPPAFNVVGASETNQLADAIGGQSQQPVQAFVVSGDVSTSQELDRNIIAGASI